MKLNADCVRDLLLFLEQQPFFETVSRSLVTPREVTLDEISQALPEYSTNELYYTTYVLSEGDFIAAVFTQEGDNNMSCMVERLTYRGHEMLDSIRDDRLWTAVKAGLSAVRNYSLAAIQSIAAGVTESAIKAYVQAADGLR